MDALADPVERVAADTGFSSVVPVDRDDEVRLAKAYGLAHRGWGVANTIATRFAIASGTKGLTALIRGAPGDTTLVRASAVPGVAVILPQLEAGCGGLLRRLAVVVAEGAAPAASTGRSESRRSLLDRLVWLGSGCLVVRARVLPSTPARRGRKKSHDLPASDPPAQAALDCDRRAPGQPGRSGPEPGRRRRRRRLRHSYGGAVVTNAATGNENVKALVYVDAFLPAEGETIAQLLGTPPGSSVLGDPTQIFDLRSIPGAPPGVVDAYVKQSLFPSCFANDLPAKQAAVLAATQRPISTVTLGQPSGPPAWAEIPSWALVGTVDRVILPATQRFMAERAGARIVEIKASHLSMISQPGAVTRLIVAAARSTS